MVDKVNFTLESSQHDNASLSESHITLTIPDYLSKDFLGIMALDVLHDAKGYGFLAGHKLSQLTDLLSEAIFFHNEDLIDENRTNIQNYVFKQVLLYFLELWSDNIKALGLSTIDVNTSIESLRGIVQLPIRTVADRVDEDAFVSLGKNKYGIEAQNYYDQRDKLSREYAETMAFVSPKGIKKPSDYFRQASGIVDIIRHRTAGNSKVVLDMKSSAGLIRTLTDPLGYTTGLPTYADPGYNMPGMSAIRQHAEVAFLNTDNQEGYYSGTRDFRYCIQLETPLCDEPITILDVTYFYGVAKDGLDRSNVLISILDETFKSSLPRSMMMADSLGKYLKPAPQEHTVTIADTLSAVERLIWNYYETLCPQLASTQTLQLVYTQLHQNTNVTLDTFNTLVQHTPYKKLGPILYEWCTKENMVFRISYILATLQNLQYFNVSYLPNDLECLFPEQMISSTLPTMMYEYMRGCNHIDLLAFSYHQLRLLEQYIGRPNTNSVPYQAELSDLLSKQWIPKRKGKLVTQINKQVLEWRKNQSLQLESMQENITGYLQDLITACNQNLGVIVDLDHSDEPDQRVDSLLQALPQFQPSIALEQVLSSHLHFYNPEMYIRTANVLRTGLLMATLLDTMLYAKPLLHVSIDLQTLLTTVIHPSADEYHDDHNTYDALRSVIGKFSGDFGQIMWCICYGHIFASEDNNTSAMALMLHRLPKQYINTNGSSSVWGNIHGLGDGSCVDVTIDK